MFVPVYALVVIGVVAVLLAGLTALSVFAWFGIAQEHNALLDRVKIMQIDVYAVKKPLRRVGGQG